MIRTALFTKAHSVKPESMPPVATPPKKCLHPDTVIPFASYPPCCRYIGSSQLFAVLTTLNPGCHPDCITHKIQHHKPTLNQRSQHRNFYAPNIRVWKKSPPYSANLVSQIHIFLLHTMQPCK